MHVDWTLTGDGILALLRSARRNIWGIAGLAALLFAILGAVRLLWGGALLPAGLSIGSLLALLGGTLAFLAVMIQIEAERRARDEERESQRRTVAAALLSEIDIFYLRYWEKRSELFESWDKMKTDTKAVEVYKVIVGRPFVVYEASAEKLGTLGETNARWVVLCYGVLDGYVQRLLHYEQVRRSGTVEPVFVELQRKIRDSTEQDVSLALNVCKLLADLAKIDFSKFSIARESCAHAKTVSESVVSCQSCNQVISRSAQDAQTH